jgi:HlyD family secretion protein
MRATWAWTGLVLVAMAGGSYGLYAWLQPNPLPSQLLYANGHIEGTEVHVAAEVAGRVIASRVVEGRTVRRGDLLVQLDDSELKLQKARAEAEVASLHSQRKASSAELALWQHHQETAQTELGRVRQLKDKGAATAQQLDQAENVAKEADGRVAALKAQLASFEDRIQAARREVDLIALKIEKTRVLAPINGTILAKTAEVGEFLQPGRTVAVLVDLSQITLKVFLPEAEVGKVKLGAAARVRVDAFPNRLFDARIERVDQQAQFTPRDIHMPQERTRMVFGITLAVDNRDRLLKPGMPADAWILWQSQAGWPSQLFVPG